MNTAELQTLARAATPGPWARHVEDGGSGWIEVRGDPDKNPLFLTGGGSVDRQLANAAFISATDPQTVLALTEAVEAAQGTIVDLEDAAFIFFAGQPAEHFAMEIVEIKDRLRAALAGVEAA